MIKVFETGPTPNNIKRRDFLLKKFSNYVDLAKCEILEVGCGNGRFAVLLLPYVSKYYGIDPDKERLELAKKGANRFLTMLPNERASCSDS